MAKTNGCTHCAAMREFGDEGIILSDHSSLYEHEI
jgi:hypothetical protein